MARDEFARRRRALLKQMGRDSIAILPAAPVRLRNNDVEYPYRQDSDFQYLTGFDEPEAVAVLVPGRALAEYILFVRVGVQLLFEELGVARAPAAPTAAPLH